MAVYARGYRSYEGTFRGPPVAWCIFTEGARMALRRRGVRWIMRLIALICCVYAGVLYFQFGLSRQAGDTLRAFGMDPSDRGNLAQRLREFHGISSVLASIAALLVGAGLVADDLRTRALALYLVRPIRPVDYMIGKAFILPAILVPLALVPGLTLWLILGLWQPAGETGVFLTENADVAWRVVRFYSIAALSMTGLMLLLSSRTPRRGVVLGLGAAIVFGGLVLRRIGTRIDSIWGEMLRGADLLNNMTCDFKTAAPRRFERRSGRDWHPEVETTWIVATALLVLGLYLTWRRARTVEVDE
jgi:hypothetical protein